MKAKAAADDNSKRTQTFGKTPFALSLPFARACARISVDVFLSILSFLSILCALVVHLLCICCAKCVHFSVHFFCREPRNPLRRNGFPACGCVQKSVHFRVQIAAIFAAFSALSVFRPKFLSFQNISPSQSRKRGFVAPFPQRPGIS